MMGYCAANGGGRDESPMRTPSVESRLYDYLAKSSLYRDLFIDVEHIKSGVGFVSPVPSTNPAKLQCFGIISDLLTTL
jgi:hypothetical protein